MKSDIGLTQFERVRISTTNLRSTYITVCRRWSPTWIRRSRSAPKFQGVWLDLDALRPEILVVGTPEIGDAAIGAQL
jgi:hypothetical protein